MATLGNRGSSSSASETEKAVRKVIGSSHSAIVDVLRERRAAIKTGRLKGRRLFGEEKREVRSVTSYYDSSSGSETEASDDVSSVVYGVCCSCSCPCPCCSSHSDGKEAFMLYDVSAWRRRWIALMAMLMLVLAAGIISNRRLEGYVGEQGSLAPT